MKTKKQHTLAQWLKKATDAELTDGALRSAYRIKTLKECENRDATVLRAAKANGVTWGNGKRCSPHRRCGNLACHICRRRAQLAFITIWANLFRPSHARGVKNEK